MARISKDYDERRSEIIDTALSLFMTKGYENTSINFINEVIGISKGTFYYYFKSKVDLLDAIVDEKAKEMLVSLMQIVNDKKLNAIAKINQFFAESVNIKAEMKDLVQMLIRVWMKDENLLIRHKMEKRNLLLIAPAIQAIIKQGIKEKSFHLDSSEGIAELILKLGTILNDIVTECYLEDVDNPPADKIIKLTETYQTAVERILGAPENSIKLFDLEILLEMIIPADKQNRKLSE